MNPTDSLTEMDSFKGGPYGERMSEVQSKAVNELQNKGLYLLLLRHPHEK
jgi:hypothetical protein